MTSWPLPRVTRAAVFAGVSVTFAAAAHTSMFQRPLPAGALVTAFAATTLVSRLLVGRGLSLMATGVWAGTVQAALHVLFARAAHPLFGAHEHNPSAHLSHGPDCPVGAALQLQHLRDAPSNGMIAAHMLAAVGCVLCLRYGESFVCAAMETLRGLACIPFPLRIASCDHIAAPLPHRPRQDRTGSPRLLLLAHALVRRGPPLLTSV